ncbi:uncharacterized protein LOC117122239 isoform X2 [Anneissia japonica]|uniref:uncharacterized protein LOC117122239 isoform X2 n=1 Tax=Anneissia japonica TaxID=1529436 RepID=UPI0014256242|nr:uncharacterized protein LOC117122239 isoform X2 [Anneissia japonica]
MYGDVIQHPRNTDVPTNQVHSVEDNATPSSVTREDHHLYSQLKNYMFFMKVIGVFHDPPFVDVGKLESTSWKSWHAIVSLLSVFNFVRYIPEIWKPDFYPGLTYIEIIMSAFFFHCMCIIIAFYVMCSKKSGFLAFFEHNQKYCNSIDSRILRCVPGKKQTKVEIHDFNDKVYRLTVFSTMPCNNRLIPIHMLFLSRLNGPPVGFSVFGLITINKEVLLTLVGMIFTYFTILVQFE